MSNQHEHLHNHSCTQCGCNSPLVTALKDELFSKENFAALPTEKNDIETAEPQAIMFYGGTIRPMIDGSVDKVEAVGFADGKVVAAGDQQYVSDYMQQNYPDYTSRELEPGHTLLPGLVEPHVHIIPTALLMSWVDVGAFHEQVLREGYGMTMVSDILKEKVHSVKDKEWLLAAGLDPALMPLQDNNRELITINVQLMDDITTAVPLLIMSASMHTMYANTKALYDIFHHPRNTKLREKYLDVFEAYKIATHGRLQEAEQMHPALISIPPAQIVNMFLQSFKYIKQFFDTANQRGVTFLYDAGMNKELKMLLDVYLAVHKRQVRIGAAQIVSDLQQATDLPPYEAPDKYEDVYISHVKVISDGSNQGLTGYQAEPYRCKPEHNYGIFNFGQKETKRPLTPPDEYRAIMEMVIGQKRWPLMLHANGNRAIEFGIEMFKDYIPKPITDTRHRIEHCSLTTQDNLLTMKSLGVSPSFLIGHVGYWGYAFHEAIFRDKSEMLDRCNSALKEGMRITLHSDKNVSPLGPLRMMEQSITRIMEADPALQSLHPDECISASQALTAITYDAAWQCYAENWAGSLKTGHFADFVILQADPLTIQDPYMHIRNIPVLETWVGGLQVYVSQPQEANMSVA